MTAMNSRRCIGKVSLTNEPNSIPTVQHHASGAAEKCHATGPQSSHINVRCGSNSALRLRNGYVRFAPDSDRTAEIPERQLRATVDIGRLIRPPRRQSAESRDGLSNQALWPPSDLSPVPIWLAAVSVIQPVLRP